MDAKSLISVRNRNNGFTGYSIPDKGIWRNFAPGEIKKISLEELQQLQYQPGGEYTLNNLLVVQDASALKYLNMQVEPEYNYTEKDIKNLLLNGSLDQLKDFLDFAPEGAIEIAKEIAVNEEIPDIRKRDAISEATGFNINNAINVNHAMAEDDKPKQEESTKTRRTEPMNAESTKTRRTDPMIGSSTLPNYKVINQK